MKRAQWQALAFCLWASTAPLYADTPSSISGIILDSSTASVPGALITIVHEDTGFRRETVSAQDGGYVVSPLQPGLYKITVRKTGFRTMIRFGVQLKTQPVHVDFNLVVGSVLETITVEGAPPILERTDASVGVLIGRDDFANLPLNGRGLLGALELSPGTIVTPATRGESGQFTVNGQRPNTHYFLVDGVSANSGVSGGGASAQATGGTLPGMTAFGSLDGVVPLDDLQDLRIQTSSTAPQFGRMPGAQISVNSRSGSNQFHGDVFYGFRNEALAANDWFANQHGDPRAPLRLQNVESSLGGPLRRNRTFFFANYDRLRFQQPFAGSIAVPSQSARADAPAYIQPALNLFPTANGPDLGNGLSTWSGGISRPSQLDAGSLRIDQAITSRLTAFARYSDSASATSFGASPVNLLDVESRGITAGTSLRVHGSWLFDGRFSASSARLHSDWQPADCELAALVAHLYPLNTDCNSLVRISISGLGQVLSGSEGLRKQSQLQATENSTWTWRGHTVHFGGDFRRLTPRRDDAASTISAIASDVAFDNLWKAELAPRHAGATVHEYSLYASDTWQIGSRLTATFGLRWEISPAPISSSADSAKTTDSQTAFQGPLWKSHYDNFAPRFGVAYRLTRNGSTVLRAGGGFYFDSSLSLATDLINDGPLNVEQYSRQLSISAFILDYGFLPNLRLPLVKQWNASLEHAFSPHDTVTLGYVGSSSDNLIRREIGGPGTSDRIWLALATNHGESNYQSLQAHYRRRLAHGVQAVVSYSWSHSLDNSSADGGLYWTPSTASAAQDRASSDFDVRHALTAGFTYEAWHGWTLDGLFHARSGFPINVLAEEQYLGISFENAFRPNLVAGQPLWIGRQINPAAFAPAPDATQGTLGRNALTGFGMNQLDLAVRREFAIGERRSVLLRIEGFNALNHANFADPVRYLASPLFGQSTSMLSYQLGSGSPGSGLAPLFQSGGARSIQLSLRFRF